MPWLDGSNLKLAACFTQTIQNAMPDILGATIQPCKYGRTKIAYAQIPKTARNDDFSGWRGWQDFACHCLAVFFIKFRRSGYLMQPDFSMARTAQIHTHIAVPVYIF
ncbi:MULTISPECIES: hypothetical protein [Acetobacter]|uniref:hypothetical protein n=1 Tax=Acetobacter TaxID=434 RepID=UPI001FC9BE72|nr:MULTISPECIES: hypothetical protein [Acetobacter]MCP1202186.1 hypothetical protein [Acetobacter oryzoeni]